ncbi:dihydrodipicolinate synthase family protein [Segetibacter koreensis]|uniref:dihydrodipicolinate synthase family protein n=1 Tax=Segetibacter koreensis TaxID=398037 RepID=UPI000371E8F2|nr:dihydrodipicolinate synthase family protein [Segetibacter koreensis]
MNTNENKLFPVLLTPFDLKAKVDYDVLGRLIDFYLAAGAKGFFANCFSSEMYSLSEDERLELAKYIVHRVKGRVPVLATGSFGLTIFDKAEFTRKIYAIGVDAVILITSHYANADESDNVLLQNFEKMLRLTDNIPMGLYECPVPYKRILKADVFKKLLATDRIFYHKDATVDPDVMKAKLEIAKEFPSLQIFESYTPNALQSLNCGAKGISSISGIFFPELVAWLCNNATNHDKTSKVHWLQEELTPVDELIHDAYPMSAKYFLRRRGLPIRLISRAYAKELTAKQKQLLDEVYNKFINWCATLHIEPVNVEEVLLPPGRLDPAF